jgi:hypothetical protein
MYILRILLYKNVGIFSGFAQWGVHEGQDILLDCYKNATDEGHQRTSKSRISFFGKPCGVTQNTTTEAQQPAQQKEPGGAIC